MFRQRTFSLVVLTLLPYFHAIGPVSSVIIRSLSSAGSLMDAPMIFRLEKKLGSARLKTVNLKLRGGGGALDGSLFYAPGLPSVSETLSMRGALGGTCGDPPNIPCDITSNNHLDMIASPKALSILGTSAVEIPEPEVNIPEFKAQGENFYRAHVSRGAAIVAEESGERLLMCRAMFRRFDSDGDGFLQQSEFQCLLNATRKSEDDILLELDSETWAQIINDTDSNPSRGLDINGLLVLYSLPGEDVKADFYQVFTNSSLQQLPIPLHPFPDPSSSDPDPLLGRMLDPGLASQLRRWQLEPSFVKAGTDVWAQKPLEDCIDSTPGLHWHERDWAEFDHRLLRDFLFELSLQADVKQRPTQAQAPHLPGPPSLIPPETKVPVTASPVNVYGLTWPEYLERVAREAPCYTDFRFHPNPQPPGRTHPPHPPSPRRPHPPSPIRVLGTPP